MGQTVASRKAPGPEGSGTCGLRAEKRSHIMVASRGSGTRAVTPLPSGYVTLGKLLHSVPPSAFLSVKWGSWWTIS